MSGGIIFGHAVLSNARNKKANLVISLGLSVRNLSGHGNWGDPLSVQQFLWALGNTVAVLRGVRIKFDTCHFCSAVKTESWRESSRF